MTQRQLFHYIREAGFTAGQLFTIIIWLPSDLSKLNKRILGKCLPYWKKEFKEIDEWTKLLDNVQRKQDEQEDKDFKF